MKAMITTEHVLDIVLEQVNVAWCSSTISVFHRDKRTPLAKVRTWYEKLARVQLTADPTSAPLMCTSTTEPPIPMPVVPNVVSLSGSLPPGSGPLN